MSGSPTARASKSRPIRSARCPRRSRAPRSSQKWCTPGSGSTAPVHAAVAVRAPDGQSVSRSRTGEGGSTALIPSATSVVGVGALAAIVAANRGDEPSAFVVPSAIAFLGPMIAGSAIALVGVVRRSRPLLLVAGTTLGVMSVMAFSGVTLILLVPSVLLFHAASKDDRARRHQPASVRRWLLVIGGAIVTAPVVVLLVTQVGVIGFVGALLVALVVATVRQRAREHRATPPGARSIVLFFGVAAGVLGGSVVLFGRTEQLCWERTETPTGPVESIGPGSPTGEVLMTGPGEGGCGPVPTAEGLALGLFLLGGSVGLAALAPVGPRPRRASTSL